MPLRDQVRDTRSFRAFRRGAISITLGRRESRDRPARRGGQKGPRVCAERKTLHLPTGTIHPFLSKVRSVWGSNSWNVSLLDTARRRVAENPYSSSFHIGIYYRYELLPWRSHPYNPLSVCARRHAWTLLVYSESLSFLYVFLIRMDSDAPARGRYYPCYVWRRYSGATETLDNMRLTL